MAAGDQKFKATLNYVASSRPACQQAVCGMHYVALSQQTNKISKNKGNTHHVMFSDGNLLSVTHASVSCGFLCRRESVWVFIINMTVLVKPDLKELQAKGKSDEGGSPTPFPLSLLEIERRDFHMLSRGPPAACPSFPFLPAWTSTPSTTSCEMSDFLPVLGLLRSPWKTQHLSYSSWGNYVTNKPLYFW